MFPFTNSVFLGRNVKRLHDVMKRLDLERSVCSDRYIMFCDFFRLSLIPVLGNKPHIFGFLQVCTIPLKYLHSSPMQVSLAKAV